jgi:hypothetical protein
MLQRIYEIGVHDALPAFMRRKVVLSNQVALIVAFVVALPFTFISWIFFPALTIVPILGAIVCLGVIMLNQQGLVNLSRWVLSVTPLVLSAIYNAALVPAGEAPLVETYLIEMSFVFIPLIIFDFREKQYLYTSLSLALLIFLTFDLSNQWVEMNLDASVLQNSYVSKLSIVLGLGISIGCILILIKENRGAEQKAEQLLEEARQNRQQVEASEKELKENLAQLRQNQEAEEKRRWAAEGLAQATRILREYDDISQLYDSLIAFIVQYTDANQGGIFIVSDEGEDKFLELKACYAYERKKFLEKRIEIGEGLIGQTYLEKEHMYMTEIPVQYVNITSGLGQAPPRNLLIIPLMANETVEGIIELASFNKMDEHTIQFMNSLGESIAATIRNVRINQKTKELLEESQQQTEEMRAQEEEMRQNMEELNATQEEMARKQRELEQIKADLEHKQQEIEEVREQEKARAEAKIATQKKSMNAVLQKMKDKEAFYQQKIEEQEALITSLKTKVEQ